MRIISKDSYLEWDEASGTLRAIGFEKGAIRFFAGAATLFDVALPLPDRIMHRVRPDPEGAAVAADGPGIAINFGKLRSELGEFDIEVELEARPRGDGAFALRLHVANHSPYPIPQVLFPDLDGLTPTGPAAEELLRVGRNRKQLRPYTDMVITDGAASFIDLYRKTYSEYGGFDFCMKWWDLGNERQGLSVYSEDLTPDVQGLYVEKAARADRLRVSWAHYPHIQPGEEWSSPEFDLYPHPGNWQTGAKPYRAFVREALPAASGSPFLDGTLGFRTIWCSYAYPGRPPVRFRDLRAVAEDAVAHGLREISLWGWCENYMELPYSLRSELGTAADLADALAACRELGANLSPFISVRGIRPETQPEEWFEHDRLGHKRFQSWSYHPDFVPPFNPPYYDSFVSAMTCPASVGWGQAYLEGARQLAGWGFSSHGFDQTYVNALCYNPEHTHRPQETGRAFLRVLQEGIAIGRSVNPAGTFSGEFFGDLLQTFQQYTWDWFTMDPEVAAPFRFAFPRYRVGFLVDRSSRWLLEAFTHGMYLNFYPDGGEGMIGSDASFSAQVQTLARLRKEFARFFERGEYYGSTPIAWAGADQSGGAGSGLAVGALYDGAARQGAAQTRAPTGALYAADDELLLILTNPHAEPQALRGAVDLSHTERMPQGWKVTVCDAAGRPCEATAAAGQEPFRFERNMGPHDMALLVFRPS